LLVRDGVVRPIGEAGPMLGAIEVAEWRPVSVELAPNDVLVLYTDGVLDSVQAGGERFGETRLRRLAEWATGDVAALASALEGERARRAARRRTAGRGDRSGSRIRAGGHGPRSDGGFGLHLLDRLATR
jgi:hypothetical protein